QLSLTRYPFGSLADLNAVNCDVRFGSKADMCGAKEHVRFTPESGHQSVRASCQLWAKSGHRAYSITSSAAIRRDCGTVRPSARADWTFTMSSNLSACTTGMSSGLAPLRMRPT